MTITYKDAQGIAGMRVAGRLASELLDYLTPFVKPGVTTNELDKLTDAYTTQVQGAISAPGSGSARSCIGTTMSIVIAPSVS